MGTVIKELVAAELSNSFGSEKNGVKNYGVKCSFSNGQESDFEVMGEQPRFSATIVMPKRVYDSRSNDSERLSQFKVELQEALNNGKLKLYGHLVPVSECNDEGHKKVTNTSNGHEIENFAQALGKDDKDAAVNLCRRGLQRRLAAGVFKWTD